MHVLLSVCTVRQTQILSGAPTRRSSVTSLTSTTDVDVIDEASIEDLLQHDGVELMPQSSATNQKDVNTYPENDAILREVLMLATENRRLRDQNEASVCRRFQHLPAKLLHSVCRVHDNRS